MAVRRAGAIHLPPEHWWEYPDSCRTAARVLFQLVTGNKPAIDQLVLPSLRIDRRRRREDDNPVEVDIEQHEDTLHNRNWINKALAAELLCATMLSCLDSPEKVVAPCATDKKGRPKTFARGGHADAWAAYPEFAIVVEVSTKRRISYDVFKKQMTQAIKHGKALSVELDRPVYAFVINNCDIETEADIREIYRSHRPDLVNESDLGVQAGTGAAEGDVRPIALYDLGFVYILDAIHAPDRADEFRFDADVLEAALQAAYDGLKSDENAFLTGGWTATTVVKALRVQPELLPSAPGTDA